jgi:hypothetical protein
VLTLEGDAIAAITWFADTGALRRFGLPRTLPNPRALADVASLLTPGSSRHHHKIAGPWRCERAPGNLPGSGDPLSRLEPGKSGFAAALAAEQEHRSFRSRPSHGTTMSESRTETVLLIDDRSVLLRSPPARRRTAARQRDDRRRRPDHVGGHSKGGRWRRQDRGLAARRRPNLADPRVIGGLSNSL